MARRCGVRPAIGGVRLAIGGALCALALTACGTSSGASSIRTPDPRITPPPSGVRVEPIATATSAPATGIVRPHPPGPLAGELIDETPATGECTDPYVTPTASPEPPVTPDDPDATATPQRIFHATDVTPAPTPDPPALVPDDELEQRIRARLGDDASHYAVVIKDLSDGRGVNIDGERVFYSASLFKLEVMFEIFHQLDQGLLSLDERYVPTDYYAGFGLGPRLVAQCEPVTIADALTAMMAISDNTAAVMLQDRAGAGNINNAMTGLGLEQTLLTEEQSLPGTAHDFARLLETIARAQATSRDSSQAMADLMAKETINDRIPRELPAATLVAHKTGNWTDATHDAGIVYGEKSAYVMVLMSDLGFDSDASLVEADVAKIAWDYFEGTAP
jgi:beta-lactamase class A